MVEIWKVHPNGNYEVSSAGQVRRITRKKGAKVGRILKPATTPFGYRTVNFDGKMKFVHVLVLETFVGPRLEGQEARHRNDVKDDNVLAYLCWGTHAQNYADRVANGGGNHGSRHGLAKLTEENVSAIRAAYVHRTITQRQIAKQFGVSRECVGRVVRRRTWAHV